MAAHRLPEPERSQRALAVKRAATKRWRSNPANVDKMKDGYLRRTFGISLSDYEEMARIQCGVCAICGGVNDKAGGWLEVDHDHTTGQIRCLLCGRCNRALGMVDEDSKLLHSLANYVEAQPQGEVT